MGWLPYWNKWLFVGGRESGGECVCFHNPMGGDRVFTLPAVSLLFYSYLL